MIAKNKDLLEVKGLKKYFPIKKGIFQKTIEFVKAVGGIDFYINENETLGLVGESGCGKSTTGLAILRLINITAGSVKFEGVEIHSLNQKELREIRKSIQIIFQDPYASLNPRMTVADLVGEPLDIHNLVANKNEKYEKVRKLLYSVGLNERQMMKYPHEFSGGQRQRIGIARALSVSPKLIIADEPVSALDVSIQAQIINLLKDLQDEFGLAYLFISHDLSLVKHISDRIAVMYLGKIVEIAQKNDLFRYPMHPYTKSLISAIPIPNPEVKREKVILTGDVPNPVNIPDGCPFHPRCPIVKDICKNVVPELKEYRSEHYVSCLLYS